MKKQTKKELELQHQIDEQLDLLYDYSLIFVNQYKELQVIKTKMKQITELLRQYKDKVKFL